jgi:hypothetical protein
LSLNGGFLDDLVGCGENRVVDGDEKPSLSSNRILFQQNEFKLYFKIF